MGGVTTVGFASGVCDMGQDDYETPQHSLYSTEVDPMKASQLHAAFGLLLTMQPPPDRFVIDTT